MSRGGNRSGSVTNYILRNIRSSGDRTHDRTIQQQATLTVHGFPVLLKTKGKLTRKEPKPNKKQEDRCIVTIAPSYYPEEGQTPAKTRKIENNKRGHIGIRKTSIRPRDCNSQKKEENSAKEKSKYPEKIRWFTNRERLALPVAWITLPPQEEQFHGNLEWEAVHAEEKLARLLNTMSSAPISSNLQSATAPATTSQTLPPTIITEKVIEDPSYHKVYQTHVDTLKSVIAEHKVSSTSAAETKRVKKKNPPKLEIKIEPNRQCMDTLAQQLEEVQLADKFDNCGNLTPVITYNHVSTVSTPDEFQYGGVLSSGSSSIGSRSPSPMLEVPNLTGEIAAKFPKEAEL